MEYGDQSVVTLWYAGRGCAGLWSWRACWSQNVVLFLQGVFSAQEALSHNRISFITLISDTALHTSSPITLSWLSFCLTRFGLTSKLKPCSSQLSETCQHQALHFLFYNFKIKVPDAKGKPSLFTSSTHFCKSGQLCHSILERNIPISTLSSEFEKLFHL